MRNTFIFLLLSSLMFSTACNQDSNSSCNTDYDQSVLLVNMADNVIMPALNELKQSVSNLKNDITFFSNSPTLDQLAVVQSSFRAVYLDWQIVEYINFGPSEAVQLNKKMNNFPVNSALLEANISFGTYNLDAPDNYYSGLPALDYLLYGIADNNDAILAKYSTQAYLDYLQGTIDLMSSKFNTIVDEWTNTYKTSFVNNEGTADGTAVSMIINSLNENFENTRRLRLGIPSGYHELNVPAFPDKVEAYYSGMSLELLKANMNAAELIFKGQSSEGLDNYLQYANAKKDNENLDEVILNQFDLIDTNVNQISETLAESIVSNAIAIQDAYVALANQVVFLKTDMPSSLCVSITYIDNASDSD